MKADHPRRAIAVCRSIAAIALGLTLLPGGSLLAQTAPSSTDATTRSAEPSQSGKLAALLPKSRQLQHYGDLRAAEEVAKYDLKHHTNVSQLAGSLEELTSIYKQSGRYSEALSTGKRYQELLDKIPDADASKRQDSALMLAEILAGLGKYPEALARVDDALKIDSGWRATDPLWEAHLYSVRAQIDRLAGNDAAVAADWRSAESRLRAVLDQLVRSGPNTELEEAALKLLTESLVATDRADEAIAVRQQFLNRHQDDQTRARNWSEIAGIYATLGQDGKQEQALRAAIALEKRDEGRSKEPSSRAEQAELLERWGLVLQRLGDAEGARRRWKEAAAILEQLTEESSGSRRQTERYWSDLTTLQAVYEQLNQWPEAIRVGQRLLRHREATLLPDDPKLWRARATLGAIYARSGNTDKARQFLTESLDYWRSRSPASAGELAQTLTQLSRLALAEGNRKQALSLAEEVIQVCKEGGAGQELQLADAHDNLGDILAASDGATAALTQYRETQKLCQAHPDDYRFTGLLSATLVDVAKLYKSQGEFHRAAEYCEQALEVRKRLVGKDSGALVGLYTALASLELAADRQGKATGSELAQAEAHIAAARQICTERGWLEGPAGISVLELEAVVEVRHQKLDEARKLLGQALTLSHRSQLGDLESKIRTQLAQLDEHASPGGKEKPAKP
ncbi:MAG TPA: tetratricopeptide repeat protein [Pirellulales bacterium]|nr:tetratricopeptide repeat protein [Pirellulales bacterium]